MPTLCEDWECPAKASCALHFGRSRWYADMSDAALNLIKGPRAPDAESCTLYRRDRVRPWLVRASQESER